MLHSGVGDDGQGCRHANAIVGAQGCALGMEPVGIELHGNGVGDEIMTYGIVLLWHHVHMTLKYDALAPLETWGGRGRDDYVAHMVSQNLTAVVGSHLGHVVESFVLVTRGAWNERELTEMAPQVVGFQACEHAIINCHDGYVLFLYRVGVRYFDHTQQTTRCGREGELVSLEHGGWQCCNLTILGALNSLLGKQYVAVQDAHR